MKIEKENIYQWSYMFSLNWFEKLTYKNTNFCVWLTDLGLTNSKVVQINI